MNKMNRKIWGLVLIIISIILFLNALEITNINIFFKGWWTLIIIIPCFINLFNSNKEKKNKYVMGLLIGILLLLLIRGMVTIKLITPIIVLMAGIYLFFNNTDSNMSNFNIKKIDNNETEEFCTIFSKRIFVKEDKIRKLNLDAVFGILTFDLRTAKIEDEVLIKASAIFGKIKIIVPDDAVIKTMSIPLFGFINNNWQNKHSKKIVYIKVFSMFWSVDINE